MTPSFLLLKDISIISPRKAKDTYCRDRRPYIHFLTDSSLQSHQQFVIWYKKHSPVAEGVR